MFECSHIDLRAERRPVLTGVLSDVYKTTKGRPSKGAPGSRLRQ